jgi:hypothetical protein
MVLDTPIPSAEDFGKERQNFLPDWPNPADSCDCSQKGDYPSEPIHIGAGSGEANYPDRKEYDSNRKTVPRLKAHVSSSRESCHVRQRPTNSLKSLLLTVRIVMTIPKTIIPSVIAATCILASLFSFF